MAEFPAYHYHGDAGAPCDLQPCPLPAATDAKWRTGRSVGRTLYRDDVLVGLVDTPEMAAEIVAALGAVGRLLGPMPDAGTSLAWRDRLCASCLRPVRMWEGVDHGQQRCVILDPEPTDEGDVAIVGGTPIAVIREDVVGRYTLYRSHFHTCPKRLAKDASPHWSGDHSGCDPLQCAEVGNG